MRKEFATIADVETFFENVQENFKDEIADVVTSTSNSYFTYVEREYYGWVEQYEDGNIYVISDEDNSEDEVVEFSRSEQVHYWDGQGMSAAEWLNKDEDEISEEDALIEIYENHADEILSQINVDTELHFEGEINELEKLFENVK